MAFPEAARSKAASDKEMESLRPHEIYDLVPITSIPPRKKAISSPWVYNIKADNSFNPFGAPKERPKILIHLVLSTVYKQRERPEYG